MAEAARSPDGAQGSHRAHPAPSASPGPPKPPEETPPGTAGSWGHSTGCPQKPGLDGRVGVGQPEGGKGGPGTQGQAASPSEDWPDAFPGWGVGGWEAHSPRRLALRQAPSGGGCVVEPACCSVDASRLSLSLSEPRPLLPRAQGQQGLGLLGSPSAGGRGEASGPLGAPPPPPGSKAAPRAGEQVSDSRGSFLTDGHGLTPSHSHSTSISGRTGPLGSLRSPVRQA